MDEPLVPTKVAGALSMKAKFEKKTGCHDPFEPLLVLMLLICVVLSLLDVFAVFIFASWVPTLLLCFAVMRVHSLGSLKEQVDRFEKENKKFRKTNEDLKLNVENMSEENALLQSSNERLSQSIAGLDEVRTSLEAFAAKTGNDIGQVMTSLQSSIQEQRSIQRNAQDIQERTKRLALQQQKSMLMNLFFQFQNEDEEKGLCKDEFDTLIDMLPTQANKQMRNTIRNFAAFDSNHDGKISVKEFKACLLDCANAILGGDGGTNQGPMTEP